MFHSLHPMAEYHAAARAVGGCPIYVSDKPGHHDFNLLKKLVLLDGSILRAKLPGRPTKDCLFSDPARDGKSLLKIWNMNDYSVVVGVFNCQGAGWCKVGKKNLIHDENPGTVTGIIRAKDIDYLSTVADDKWTGDAVIFSHLSGEVVYLPKDVSIPITMKS
ncbi:flavodoxin-like fold protein [Trifolium repens]|nr:flavodoxin-like fold protein [Trifolium repens]